MPFISKKYAFVLFAISILFISSSFNAGKSKTNPSKRVVFNIGKVLRINTKNPEENFAAFLKKFETDPVFQLSRIKFPLKLTTLGGEGDKDHTKFFVKSKWKYIKHLGKNGEKWIYMKTMLSKKEIEIQFMVQDTGISIDYFFINTDGKWWLTFVKDESD